MRVVGETWEIVPLPFFAMVATPNHWHFVVQPETSDHVSEVVRRLTVMHTMRWHAHDKTGGTGHLYQGRFKSFPIQTDGHLLTVMRYVERNAVRANFIELAEDWQWSPPYARLHRADECRWQFPDDPPLPRNWRSWANKVETEAELNSLRRSVKRGLPLVMTFEPEAVPFDLVSKPRHGQEDGQRKRPEPFLSRNYHLRRAAT